VNCEDRIVFTNQACAKLLGAIAPSQLFGKTVSSLSIPSPTPRYDRESRTIRETNQPVPPTEERFVGLAGAIIDVEVAAAPIMFEGKPAIQVIATDIRARKDLERALLATNLQLQTILASATNVSIVATNTEGTITTFNTGAEELLGYTADEMIGQQSLILLHVPEESTAMPRSSAICMSVRFMVSPPWSKMPTEAGSMNGNGPTSEKTAAG
jgi:PAS domain S-box-containing protein